MQMQMQGSGAGEGAGAGAGAGASTGADACVQCTPFQVHERHVFSARHHHTVGLLAQVLNAFAPGEMYPSL